MPLPENANTSDIIGEINLIRAEFDSLRDWVNELRTASPANEQILAEMQTLAHNVTVQAQAIEQRITTREEKHAELEQVIEAIEGNTPKDVQLAEGYFDTQLNIRIKASVAAQNRFTSLVAGLINDEKLDKVNDSTIIYFYQFDESATGMPYLTFCQLMSRYKEYCQYIESIY